MFARTFLATKVVSTTKPMPKRFAITSRGPLQSSFRAVQYLLRPNNNQPLQRSGVPGILSNRRRAFFSSQATEDLVDGSSTTMLRRKHVRNCAIIAVGRCFVRVCARATGFLFCVPCCTILHSDLLHCYALFFSCKKAR